jgi:hypothetical protein
MIAENRKKIVIITGYIRELFSEQDWQTLGLLTGKLDLINNHERLLRSLSFGDDDYVRCVSEVLNKIFTDSPEYIDEVIDTYGIDLWHQQKNPDKYVKIFATKQTKSADFWIKGYVKLFVSHLSSNRKQMSLLKSHLAKWGVSAFIAHEDIQASREWRDEVEAGLDTMDILAAVVEPGFKDSEWCAQEVGYALGRKVDVLPLMAGLTPFGFFGKYQGIQIKGKIPKDVACEIVKVLVKKPEHRSNILQSMTKAFSKLSSEEKVDLMQKLADWDLLTESFAQARTLAVNLNGMR